MANPFEQSTVDPQADARRNVEMQQNQPVSKGYVTKLESSVVAVTNINALVATETHSDQFRSSLDSNEQKIADIDMDAILSNLPDMRKEKSDDLLVLLANQIVNATESPVQ